MKVLDFYKSVLSAANMSTSEEGRVSVELGGIVLPLTINQKRLVLPTKKFLAESDRSDIVLFHPLREKIMRGESEVMARYRKALNVSINYTITTLMTYVVTLATSPKLHNKLSPDQLEVMRIFKDADANTLAALRKLCDQMPPDSTDRCFTHIYIKPKAKIRERVHHRGAIISFPFYRELAESKDSGVYGVKLRKKDFASFKAFLEFLFPDIGTDGAYSRGNEDASAPTLDAILRGATAVLSCTNDLVNILLSTNEDELEDLIVEDGWSEALNDLTQFDKELSLIPAQPGNEGASLDAAQPAQHQKAPVHTPPAQNRQQENQPSDLKKLLNSAQNPPQQMPHNQGYPQQQQQRYVPLMPQSMMPHGQYGQQVFQQQQLNRADAARTGRPVWDRQYNQGYSI